ncbi:hypothetical protein F0U60_10875 [Archangium minus]|uniref:Uncharacterized protein n=1 Tax=Archangium minus TaxID=83450 RepID=A0ABY9WP11_9BACT|nr:hypothetical protein F0U60_10875 [Archangium minus]
MIILEVYYGIHVTILGFDVEWGTRVAPTANCCPCSSGILNGVVVSEVFEPPGPFLTVESFTRLVLEFIAQHGLSVPMRKRRPRKAYLVAHFAAAELSKFKDPMDELLMPCAPSTGVEWRSSSVDSIPRPWWSVTW